MKIKQMGVMIAVVWVVSVIMFTACTTYQAVATLEPRKTANTIGVGLSGDEGYGEASLIFFPDIGIEDDKWSLGFDINFKYPFHFAKNHISVFPIAGTGVRYNKTDMDEVPWGIWGIGINVGAGFDIAPIPAFSIRGKVLYQPEFSSFMTSYSGFRYSLGLGYRTEYHSLRQKPVNVIIEVTDDGLFEYINYETGITITKYLGSETSIIIPKTIGDKKINRVEFDAGEGTNITSIVIPDGVWGFNAGGRTNITSIVIPDGVRQFFGTRFGDYYDALNRAGGTYTWEDGRCYYNGKLLPELARIIGGTFLNSGTGVSRSIGLYRINGRSGNMYSSSLSDGRTEWLLMPDTYDFEVGYSRRAPGYTESSTTVVLRGVVLKEGKTYELSDTDTYLNQVERILMGAERVTIGIREVN
jgi:hypothetical protein